MTSPVNPGAVVWSGDNPGIYLKDASGAWQTLSVFSGSSPHLMGRAPAHWSSGTRSRQRDGQRPGTSVCLTMSR